MNELASGIARSQKDIALSRKQRYLNAHSIFIAFNVVFGIVFFGPIRDLVRNALDSDYFSYIPFIPLISAYLLFANRKPIYSEMDRAVAAGLCVIGIGTGLLFIGRQWGGVLDHGDQLAYISVSAIIIWLGGFVLCYGIPAFRAAVFPLLFLFFAVPLPLTVLDGVILMLQRGSAEAAYGIIRLTGVPVAKDGFVISFPTLSIEVAKQCSGIRSTLSLVITTTLAAYLFLSTAKARLLLVISAVPVAIVKNGLRIATLSILGYSVDKKILESNLHRQGGIPFFIVALLMQGFILLLLRRWERLDPGLTRERRQEGREVGAEQDENATRQEGRQEPGRRI